MRQVTTLLAAVIFLIGWPTSAADRVQLLKAYGHLPAIRLEHLETATVVGQAFDAALEDRFCGCPDFPDAEIAASQPADMARTLDLPEEYCQDLCEMHRRMLESTGRGSWPPSCYPDHWPSVGEHHSAAYHIDYDSFPAHYHRPVTEQELQGLVDAQVWGVETVAQARAKWDRGTLLKTALALSDETYRRVGCAQHETTDRSKANITIVSKPIPGSTIGYAYFNNGRCSDSVLQVIDSGYQPGLHACVGLIGHETGHNHNLQHTFEGQGSHHGVMSYSRKDPYVGYSPGEAPYDRPRDPSWTPLARYYGGEAVPFPETPPPPPPPPPDGTVTIKVGDEPVLVVGGARVKMTINSITTDEGPTFEQKVAAATAKVADYEDKEKHRQTLASLYFAVGQAVKSGKATVAEAHQTMKFVRVLLLGRDAEKWQEVFALADSVTTADGLLSVANGLGFKPTDAPNWTAADMVLVVMNGQRLDAVPPIILTVLKIVVQILPEGTLKTILQIVIEILEGLPAEPAVPIEPAKPTPAVKPEPSETGRYRQGPRFPFCIAC